MRGSRGCAHLFELHDNLGIRLAELIGGVSLAAIRATLFGLVIHAAQLSQQPLLAIQCSRHLQQHMQKTVYGLGKWDKELSWEGRGPGGGGEGSEHFLSCACCLIVCLCVCLLPFCLPLCLPFCLCVSLRCACVSLAFLRVCLLHSYELTTVGV